MCPAVRSRAPRRPMPPARRRANRSSPGLASAGGCLAAPGRRGGTGRRVPTADHRPGRPGPAADTHMRRATSHRGRPLPDGPVPADAGGRRAAPRSTGPARWWRGHPTRSLPAPPQPAAASGDPTRRPHPPEPCRQRYVARTDAVGPRLSLVDRWVTAVSDDALSLRESPSLLRASSRRLTAQADEAPRRPPSPRAAWAGPRHRPAVDWTACVARITSSGTGSLGQPFPHQS